MLARYVFAMGLAWLADVAVFAMAVVWLNIPVSQMLARTAGAITGFVLHRHITFRQASTNNSAGAMLRFAMVWLFGYGVSTALILLIVGSQLSPVGAKIVVEIGLVPINFVLLRLFVFTKRE